MGTIDDDGIGIGDVDTILDDGGGEQHIVVVVGEIEDDILEFAWLHLSMTNGHTGIGDVLMNEVGYLLQLTDTIIDEVDLTIARHLEIDGIGDDLCAKGMYLSLNGIAVGRRRLDDTEVASAYQRELEGTGDRRGRHGEGVDTRLHLAQLFLGRDAELLFLVDDQQA